MSALAKKFRVSLGVATVAVAVAAT